MFKEDNLREFEIIHSCSKKEFSEAECKDKIGECNAMIQATRGTITHFLRSRKSLWYWTTITLAAAATLGVFIIPINNPFEYVRAVLGIILVLFLPGFAFIKAFYPRNVLVETSSKDLETIEKFALSVGLSLALTSITGLVLYYSPWGMAIPPLTVGLLLLIVVLATIAVFREHQLGLRN